MEEFPLKTGSRILFKLLMSICFAAACIAMLFGCVDDENGKPDSDMGGSNAPEYQVLSASGEECRIVGLNTFIADGKLEIPETIKGQKVTEIDGLNDTSSGSAKVHTELRELTIPSSVKTVGEGAFSGMSGLKKVTFPQNNLEEIGDAAFAGCTSLTECPIGANVRTLGHDVFSGCTSLQAYTVEAGSTAFYAEDGVLYSAVDRRLISYPNGKKGTSFTVPDATVQIGAGAFAGNENLQTINLNRVTYLDSLAFAECKNLKTVTAPALNFVGADALSGTAWEESQTDEVVSLGNVLVKYNGSAQNLKIENCFSVAASAFSGNNSLRRVEIGRGVINLGSRAFFGCDHLGSVYLANLSNFVYVGDDVFGPGVSHIYIPGGEWESQYLGNAGWRQYADKLSVHRTAVSFDSNSGSACPDEALIYGGYVGRLPDPVREGYTFLGWYPDEDLSGGALSSVERWEELSDQITLYADWEPEEYLIVFATDYTAADITGLIAQTYTVEHRVEFPTPQQKTGYSFGGWFWDRGCTQDAGTALPAGTTGDKILYAKWIPNHYHVTLNGNDSTEFPATMSETECDVEYGSSDFTLPVPTRKDHSFNGWYALIGGIRVYMTDENGNAVQPWEIAEDTVLYADWTRDHYEIEV